MKQLLKLVAALGAMVAFAFSATPALAQIDYGDEDYTYDDLYSTGAVDTLSDDAAAGLYGFSMIVWVGVCCVGLLVSGGLAYLVYSDAKKNGVDNGMLWAALTFFFGLIPLLIYFLAIKKNATGTPAAK